jgi:hypothetical protein
MAKKFLTPLGLVGLASDPATGSEGQLYFNTTDDVVRVYANGEWTELSGAGGESASVYYQTEAPEGAPLGALWVDSDSTGTGGTGGGTSGTSLLYWTEDNNGNLIPDIDNIYSIGSSAYRVKDLYLGASSLYLQNPASASANISLSVDSSGNLKINDSKIITESNANNNLNLTNYATLQYAQSASAAAVSYLVDSAPGALDTLNELANALGDDQNFATTVTNALSSKLSISSASTTYQTKDLITSISANYNAQNNETIFVNSASSSINVTLPSSPTTGSKIKVLDVAANSQNNNITVLGNGKNISGASAYIINTPDSSVEVMYINATKGWNILNKYVSLEKPGIPTAVSATDVGTGRAYNDGAAIVSFTPATSGGTAISYTVTSTPGSYTQTGTSSPITITGLQSNTSYTFIVSATNATGTNISAATNSITATTVPQAPTLNSATYGFERVSVDFSANATGGKTISGYSVLRSGGGTTSGVSSPISVDLLTPGTSYTFTVSATNANGTSLSSSTSSAIAPFTATGGTVKTSGLYRYHTFTGSSSFVVTGNTIPNLAYLVLAGGGSGASCIDDGSGGGGAGGLLFATSSITVGTKTVTIGNGGGSVSAGSNYQNGLNGGNSTFDSFTATGGGGGGGGRNGNGLNGGSGGGGGGGYTGSQNYPGGTGTSSQGFSGGTGAGNNTNSGRVGGGGGGAGGVGSSPGNGGSGADYSSWYGESLIIGGGGAGAVGTGGGYSGGSGGGGGSGVAGTSNTGGGGGGRGGNVSSGAGGSGIVIVRYLI